LFVIDLASRRVQIIGSTPHPNDLFMRQVSRTLTTADEGLLCAPRVLICDYDRKWSGDVRSPGSLALTDLSRNRRRILMMSETECPGRFPSALRSSAVARWSHRDPVEGGNPFLLNDPRHEAWHVATCSARDALVRIDRELDEAEAAGPHPDSYPVRLVALSVSRFDVWARRVQAIVRSPAALQDYEVWLSTDVANWLVYVADTCPRVEVGDDLRARLSSRAQYWVAEASRALQAVDGKSHIG
jgi:hypothetical protein